MAVTTTEEFYDTIKKIKFSWVSAVDGSASGSTVKPYSGEIIRLATVPGTGGDQPSAGYDVTITDEDGIDVLAGSGTDRLSSTMQVLASNLGCVVSDKLTLNVTNAGDTKKGVVYVYIR